MQILGIILMLVAVAEPWNAPDLNPVKVREAPKHDPIIVVKNGQPKATICLMGNGTGYREAARELQTCIKLSSGAELPIVEGKISSPAIVIGECDGSRAAGLDSSKLSTEDLAIKTAPGAVYI